MFKVQAAALIVLVCVGCGSHESPPPDRKVVFNQPFETDVLVGPVEWPRCRKAIESSYVFVGKLRSHDAPITILADSRGIESNLKVLRQAAEMIDPEPPSKDGDVNESKAKSYETLRAHSIILIDHLLMCAEAAESAALGRVDAIVFDREIAAAKAAYADWKKSDVFL